MYFHYIEYSDPALIVFCERISKKMKSNSKFLRIYPLLDELDIVKNNLQSLYNIALIEDKQQQSEIRRLRVNIIERLNLIVECVDDIADGDMAIVLASGFFFKKEKELIC